MIRFALATVTFGVVAVYSLTRWRIETKKYLREQEELDKSDDDEWDD